MIGSIKKWSSQQIGRWLLQQPKAARPIPRRNGKPRFYQQESYDRIVRDAEESAAFRGYIAHNEAEANLPPEAYAYRAAEWLNAFAKREEL